MPVEMDHLAVQDVDDHRRLWCRRYDDCLDYAERNRWTSFSCSFCPVRDEMSQDEKDRSRMRMTEAADEVYAYMASTDVGRKA